MADTDAILAVSEAKIEGVDRGLELAAVYVETKCRGLIEPHVAAKIAEGIRRKKTGERRG